MGQQTLNIGIVGLGFMGRMHLGCWQKLGNVRVKAICDANPRVMGPSDKSLGNIGDIPQAAGLEGINFYDDFDRMLADERLDAVSITLPTFLHPEFSIKALEAGVNVLCEKPMALDEAQCGRMIDAASACGKKLMIAHCIRFWPEYAYAGKIIRSGIYGRVVCAGFSRLGAIPGWSENNWLIDEKRSGGMALDLHIHDSDYVQYLFGMPRAVVSGAAANNDGAVVHIATQYLYDDAKLVFAQGGWDMMPGFGFEMSFNIALEDATIIYDCTRRPAFRICTMQNQTVLPDADRSDGYQKEIEHFAAMLSGGDVPQVITPAQSMDSVRLVKAEIESARTKKTVLL